jgi:hypothetical protein
MLMLAETYKALVAAGVSADQAEKAAAELAGYESRFVAIDTRFATLESTQRLHSWMLTYLIIVVTTLAFKAFS